MRRDRPPPLAAVPALALLVALLVVALAGPARAHSRVDEYAGDVDSRITSSPELAGLEWTLHTGGALVELENTGSQEVVVLGYEGEPYLRVGPDGVFENRHSPATYLNQERYGDVALPPRADPSAGPDWVRVHERPRAVWHDHRTHWMSPQPPPGDGDEPRRLGRWELPFHQQGSEHSLVGELWLLPAPSPWPFALAALALTAPAGVGLWLLRSAPTAPTDRRLLRPAAATVALVALANAVHLPDELLAQPQPALDVVFGLLHTSLFVGTGLVGALVAWRGRGPVRAALGVGAGALLFHQGLLHLPGLAAAVLPTALPDGAFRLLVTVSLVQALPVALVLLATREHRSEGPKVPRGTDHPAPVARDAQHSSA